METNTLGWGGQDVSQRPRDHTGIHLSTPFPQEALQRPGPAQGHWEANLGTCPQQVQFLPEVGEWRMSMLSLFILSSAPWGCEGWGRQAECWVATAGPSLGGL